jgi:hypothetical protein
MRTPSANELLKVWERGHASSSARRGLLLLCTAYADMDEHVLARWSIGRRDASLLDMREQTFGSRLQSIVACPRCAERLEFDFTVANIRVPMSEEPGCVDLRLGEYTVRARLPNSDDLEHLTPGTDMDVALVSLIEQCTLQALHQGEEITPGDLPTEVKEALSAAMSERDAQGNVQLLLSCPACQHEWQATFDIVSFFWSEIHSWAVGLLSEVHALASAYGWREADILAMAPIRRQLYLEMQGA